MSMLRSEFDDHGGHVVLMGIAGLAETMGGIQQGVDDFRGRFCAFAPHEIQRAALAEFLAAVRLSFEDAVRQQQDPIARRQVDPGWGQALLAAVDADRSGVRRQGRFDAAVGSGALSLWLLAWRVRRAEAGA